ncbi:class I SAM-dependent methyltransferase [Algirhabdus cladophorae]|uniref:class I SAM-dependent methyltransferase n=1 Tax=Algirhabdus cladophorae TaxID=3377108 RepID=UPI003B84523C
MSDEETIGVYNTRVGEYVTAFTKGTQDDDLIAFIAKMPKGATVLDLGCGPAAASAHMRAAGLKPDPVDASVEMVRFANETHDIGARVGRFEDIVEGAVYDGVWANFSLLHAPRAQMPNHLEALHRALKPQGLLHLGLKLGEDAGRDKIGRFYTYYTEPELEALLDAAGFKITHSRTDAAAGMAGTVDPFIILHAVKS